jgi:hypothetical protein
VQHGRRIDARFGGNGANRGRRVTPRREAATGNLENELARGALAWATPRPCHVAILRTVTFYARPCPKLALAALVVAVSSPGSAPWEFNAH